MILYIWSIHRYFGDFRGILIKKISLGGYFGCFRGFNIILMILGIFWSFSTFRGCFEDFNDFRGILVILEVLENFFYLF